jgi:hypothetical protein
MSVGLEQALSASIITRDGVAAHVWDLEHLLELSRATRRDALVVLELDESIRCQDVDLPHDQRDIVHTRGTRVGVGLVVFEAKMPLPLVCLNCFSERGDILTTIVRGFGRHLKLNLISILWLLATVNGIAVQQVTNVSTWRMGSIRYRPESRTSLMS